MELEKSSHLHMHNKPRNEQIQVEIRRNTIKKLMFKRYIVVTW